MAELSAFNHRPPTKILQRAEEMHLATNLQDDK